MKNHTRLIGNITWPLIGAAAVAALAWALTAVGEGVRALAGAAHA